MKRDIQRRSKITKPNDLALFCRLSILVILTVFRNKCTTYRSWWRGVILGNLRSPYKLVCLHSFKWELQENCQSRGGVSLQKKDKEENDMRKYMRVERILTVQVLVFFQCPRTQRWRLLVYPEVHSIQVLLCMSLSKPQKMRNSSSGLWFSISEFSNKLL